MRRALSFTPFMAASLAASAALSGSDSNAQKAVPALANYHLPSFAAIAATEQRRFLNVKKLDNIQKPSEVFADGAADAVVDGEFRQGAQEMREGAFEGAVRAWDKVKDTAKAAGSVFKEDDAHPANTDGSLAQRREIGTMKARRSVSNETFDNETGAPSWERAKGANEEQRGIRGGEHSSRFPESDAASQFISEREFVERELSKSDNCGMGAGARADGNINKGESRE